MINKAILSRVALIATVSIGLLPALAQVTSPVDAGSTATTVSRSDSETTGGRRHVVRHRENNNDRKTHRSFSEERRSNGDRDGHRDRGDRRRYDPEAFRKLMTAELSEVPALNQRMNRLMDIQTQRFELQKQRQAVARNKDANRETTVKKFHGLLKRDHDLSDEARQIVQEIVADMPRIQGELDGRRASLSSALEQANSATTDTETSSPEARELRRKMRYVDFLEKKLGDLKTHPERLDLLARVLRGLPYDDPSAPEDISRRNREAAATPEDRLAELRLKRRVLQRELKEVEDQIEQLRQQGVGSADAER